jgi:hypothetical protein
VYSRFSLTHLGDPGAAVAAFHRHLRRGGVVAGRGYRLQRLLQSIRRRRRSSAIASGIARPSSNAAAIPTLARAFPVS